MKAHWKLPLLFSLAPARLPTEKVVQWGVQGLACLAVAWAVAQSLWWVFTPRSATAAAQPSPSLSEQTHRVVARHFFDVAIESPHGAAPGETPSPMELRWRVIGTYVVSGGQSRAVLAMDGHSDAVVVKVGDQLSSGHEVVEVRPDGVALSKNAQRSELELVLGPTPSGAPDQGPLESRFGTTRPSSPMKDF